MPVYWTDEMIPGDEPRPKLNKHVKDFWNNVFGGIIFVGLLITIYVIIFMVEGL